MVGRKFLEKEAQDVGFPGSPSGHCFLGCFWCRWRMQYWTPMT